MDLALEGLIYESSSNAIYTWKSLSQTEKDRIKKVNINYEKSKNNECN